MDAEGEMTRKPTEESVRGTLPPRYKLNTDDDQHVEIQKYAHTRAQRGAAMTRSR
jgi:hypothetical protein